MNELQTRGFENFNNSQDGKSYYLVHLADGQVATYEFATAVQMRSYKHIYDALDNPGQYRFFDANGVLVIQPRTPD